MGFGFGVVVVLGVVVRVVVVAVVVADGTDWVGVVGVVPVDVEVMVAAHATPAPKKIAHTAITTARASAKPS